MIKLLLDIGLPRRAASDLRAEGMTIEHAAELGLATATDSEILTFAAREGFTVVTLDFDFARIMATEIRAAPSLIHLRLPNLDRFATVQLLREILPRLTADLEKGCIASVGSTGIRVRPIPLSPPSPRM